MRYLLLFILPVFFWACPSEQKIAIPLLSSSNQQVVLVVTPDDEATKGELRRFEREPNGQWKEVGSAHDVMVGRSGLAWGRGMHASQEGQQKEEGDGKAPAGVFRLGEIFGYEPPMDVTFNMPFVRSNEVLECVDDSESKAYNKLVDSIRVKKDWNSSEFMRRDDHQYKWGVVVHHNQAAVPKGGSCIFLHIWEEEGHPTAGCTSMKESDMLQLIHWLDKKKSPVLVQLPKDRVAEYKEKWRMDFLE